ncbi:MAG TPA: 2Fe-2S iron-sulfur cluster-binding protein [Usitatibacter sp.]|nr:2Fe-2S iron-sulfur cluster-binding protein [Usitatibacter sp.]
MHSIKLADGAEYRCAADDTLLRAGLRAGLGFPYECNAGSCGTCKVDLLEGQIASLRPDAPGLGERDRAKGRVLACQARPLSDCSIKVRLRPENVPAHRPARFRATLAATRDLTHDMREFRFKAGAGSPGFLPGQYALFYLPGLEAPRTYSMANIDDGSGEWHFIVRRVAGGVGTVTLFDKVQVGSTIELDGPYGLAYLRTDSPRDLICIGGGSGLAPVLSIARGAIAEPKLAGRRIHVFYGARTTLDLCGDADLSTLPGYGERLTFEAVLSMPEQSPAAWTGPTGFVHDHVQKFIGERWGDFEYYFAGPPAMAEAVQRMLIDKRVPYPQVHFDSFY